MGNFTTILPRIRPRLANASRRLFGSREGGVAAIAAGGLAAFIGAAAIAVDWGSFFVAKRNLQAMADLAALTAAQNAGDAERAVRLALADHAFDAHGLSVEIGRYVADPSLPPADRFTPTTVDANAARVRLDAQTPVFLGRIFSDSGAVALSASAVARRADQAAFSVGSRLLALRDGLANDLLGALLGVRVNLTVVDYDGLVGADVKIAGLLDAIARELDVDVGGYEGILAATVSAPEFLRALASVVEGPGRAVLQRLANDAAGSPASIPLSSLIAVSQGETLASAALQGLDVSASAADAVFAAAQAANGDRQVAVDIGAHLPGVADAQLALRVGERPVGSGWINVGGASARVQTAQIRLRINLRVGVSKAVEVNLPVHVEVASAEARLSRIACPWRDPDMTRVSVGVLPSAVEAWIGRMSADFLGSMTEAFRVSPARIVSVAGLVSVDASSHVRSGAADPQDLQFDRRDVADGRIRTVASNDLARTLASSLVEDLDLRVSLLGGMLSLGLDAEGLKRSISAALTPVAGALDLVLREVAGILGVSIGEADVKVGGVWCGRAVLVQ